jgi:murein DD-endopeptidase MepM/ murein hydrolase activator NlpD
MLKSLPERFKVLILPVTGVASWQLDISKRWLMVGLAAWGTVTLWAGWMSWSHSDYIATKAEVQVLREELERSKDDIDRVREADKQLRAMLQMGDKRKVIEQTTGEGGPGHAALVEFRAKELAALRDEARKRLTSFTEISGYIDRERKIFRATPQGWPTVGRLTSKYGHRNSPINEEGEVEFHAGLDIANAKGTLILATADGVVRKAGWARGYGQVILIRHDKKFSTLFGHTAKILVKEGQKVERGQPIALMGTTGRSTGTHLHYEVWREGRTVDPRRYLGSYREE